MFYSVQMYSIHIWKVNVFLCKWDISKVGEKETNQISVACQVTGPNYIVNR